MEEQAIACGFAHQRFGHLVRRHRGHLGLGMRLAHRHPGIRDDHIRSSYGELRVARQHEGMIAGAILGGRNDRRIGILSFGASRRNIEPEQAARLDDRMQDVIAVPQPCPARIL